METAIQNLIDILFPVPHIFELYEVKQTEHIDSVCTLNREYIGRRWIISAYRTGWEVRPKNREARYFFKDLNSAIILFTLEEMESEDAT